MNYVGVKVKDRLIVSLIPGNLILLLNSGLKNVTAVEPNDEMQKIG